MCMSSPKSPQISEPAAPPPEPAPTADKIADPNAASGDLKKQRKGLAALRINTAANVPSVGAGVNS